MKRKFPRKIKRVVIKVGSSVIATDLMKPRDDQLKRLVGQIVKLKSKGIEVVLVSSGAIALGMGVLGKKKRSPDLSVLQTLAAVGQTALMNKYNELFKKKKTHCAQLLLTWDDFDNRTRFNNVRNTIQAMFNENLVPIVNENDTISTDEIKFGDNDKLSALVASLVNADLLLILSDVDGLYDLDKKVFNEIKEITTEIRSVASGTSKKQLAKGGMSAKLEAVNITAHAKIPSVIANGETKDVILRVVNAERIGTLFIEKDKKVLARKHWISFGAKPKGTLVVDDGAKKVLLTGGKSLLLVGVSNWDGHFKNGDIVIVADKKGNEIGRGISNYSSTALNNILDKKGQPEAIHVDDLVLGER
ncbi:MAG: glutamate 5-kinase [Lysobacterales bacterium]|jgi:glutamate 5-kinase